MSIAGSPYGVLPRQISEITERLQVYNGTMVDKWLVNMKLFREPHAEQEPDKSVYLVDFEGGIQQDAIYLVTVNKEGLLSQVQSKRGLERIVQRHVHYLQLRQTAKVEGIEYTIGSDLCVRLGTLSIGTTIKGYVWMELEYLPCEDADNCEILLLDCFRHFIQPSYNVESLFFVPFSSRLRLARGSQYVELLRKETLL